MLQLPSSFFFGQFDSGQPLDVFFLNLESVRAEDTYILVGDVLSRACVLLRWAAGHLDRACRASDRFPFFKLKLLTKEFEIDYV